MGKRLLSLPLLVCCAGLPAHAQLDSGAMELSPMFDLFQAGQLATVQEMNFGYHVQLRAPNSAKTGSARIENVLSDHLVLQYPDGREQYLAKRAIVAVTRYPQSDSVPGAGTEPADQTATSRAEPTLVGPARVDLAGGYIETGMNEVSIISTIDDPPGLRLGVKRLEGWGRSLGKFSFNSVRPDGVQDECVLIQGKVDERFPPALLVGEYSFFLRTPPGGGDEGDMVRVLTLQHDRILLHVPVVSDAGD